MAEPLPPPTDNACASCGEGVEQERCAKSQRPCGHHCNHVWTHDACDWCGSVWIENGIEVPAKPEAGG
jgi:hypothetical protein